MNATPQMLFDAQTRPARADTEQAIAFSLENCMTVADTLETQGLDQQRHDAATHIQQLPELEINFDKSDGIYWQFMAPSRRPSCTLEFLRGVQASHRQIRDLMHRMPGAMRYFVTASRMPGIFNLGGDLPHFVELIRRRDRAGLLNYAYTCIDVQADRATNMELPYVSISLVQGDALGGGFECALADDVIVAEKGTKFGLPEVLFGLFPGMGAYSLLSRKLGTAQAERMITSGQLYTAEALHDMGLVEVLAEPGEGIAAVQDFVRRQDRTFAARTALSKVRRRVQPVTREELADVTEIWVEAALQLDNANVRKMERLAKAQDRRRAAGRSQSDVMAA